MTEYGQPDEDLTAYNTLLSYVTVEDVKYIMHHQRMPIGARPCKLPLSLRVQAILLNGTVVTAFQAQPNAVALIQLS